MIRVFTSRLGDRFGPNVLLYPAFVAMPIAFFVLAHAKDRIGMIAAATLFGMGLGAAFPAFMTFVVSNTGEDRRARTFGSVILAFDTGIGVGSVVIGAIGERAGLGMAFQVAAVVACLSIPIFLATSRRLTRAARQLLRTPSMPEPEPEKSDEHVERHVVYETVSSSSTRSTGITIGIVLVIAIALIVWIVMQMR